MCPYCRDTRRYTDPNLQVRCTRCFAVLNDQAAGTPMGRLQDLDAPMVVAGHTYYGAYTDRDRAW